MRDRNDLNDCGRGSVDNQIGETAKQITACSVKIRWIEFRSNLNALHSNIDLREKRFRRVFAPRPIPLPDGTRFFDRLGMDLDR